MREISSVSLKEFSHIRIGGTARTVYFPENLQELCQLAAGHPGAPLIGGGSNIFFADTEYPAVICTRELKTVTHNSNGTVTAECGVLLADWFDFAVGAPATLGGGVILNFGAFGKELKDYLVSVQTCDKHGSTKEFPAAAITFGYRYSSLHKEKKIVLAATFRPDLEGNKKEYTTKRKDSIPYDFPNIGSIFKNPESQSAGKLIEQCGLKGLQIGDIQVSQKHANILINRGNASAQELLTLMNMIKTKVKEKFGVTLEEEVECL